MTQDAQPSPDDAPARAGQPSPNAAPPPAAGGYPTAPPPTWHADPAPAGMSAGRQPWPTPSPAPVPPPPADAVRRTTRVDPVPGTPFGVVQLAVPPVVAGTAVGALVAGIGSILVALLVALFGLLGARDGWGALAGGAFAVPSALAGLAAVLLGVIGRRQVNRPAPPPAVRFTGRGLAVAGIGCGAAGLGVTVLAFAAALIASLA
ncbi:phage holin family protein [Plantactinospora sp. GCM10030261]|uniref:phage holin family protein n=1 Tax=Plantactinospora sp. GCM10030261 TaxID=3273420 RepID=UPI00360F4371